MILPDLQLGLLLSQLVLQLLGKGRKFPNPSSEGGLAPFLLPTQVFSPNTQMAAVWKFNSLGLKHHLQFYFFILFLVPYYALFPVARETIQKH